MSGIVIIVDRDLGFAFWLGRALEQAGYDALPAAGVAAAKSLLAELKIVVDLVVINAGVLDAASFVDDLRAAQPRCKFILVVDNSDNPPADLPFADLPFADLPFADLVEHKPLQKDGSLLADWVETVRIFFRQRRQHMDLPLL